MSNFNNIARPYALAAFEYAQEHNALAAWKIFLANSSAIAEDEEMTKIFGNPAVTAASFVSIFQDILSIHVNNAQLNFLQLLAENKRLMILTDIHRLFIEHCERLTQTLHVKVVTAVQTDDIFQQKLAKALAKRLHHEVTLSNEIDPDILGGAVIYLGDRVIDGSLRGKLTRLLEFSLR